MANETNGQNNEYLEIPSPLAHPTIEALKWLEKFPESRAIVETARREVLTGELEIITLPPPDSKKPHLLRQSGGFDFDGLVKRIQIDVKLELGFRSLALFHELTHSQDREYLSSYSAECALLRNLEETTQAFKRAYAKLLRQENPAEETYNPGDRIRLHSLRKKYVQFRDLRLLRTERNAYHELHRFFRARIADETFTPSHYRGIPWGRALTQLPTDAEICSAYGLALIPG